MLRNIHSRFAKWERYAHHQYIIAVPQTNCPFYLYIHVFHSCLERGKFLALDLGGTNFRVLIIHLKGEHEFEMQSKIYAIPQNIMLGSGVQLFDHIAECLANFMKVINYLD